MVKYVLVFLFSVFISSLSQIILKTSANQKYDNWIREYLNVKVIVAYTIFFTSSLLTILAYRGVPLSMGPILEASGYIWVAVLGRLVLKEKISKEKMLGLALILIGIIVFSL